MPVFYIDGHFQPVFLYDYFVGYLAEKHALFEGQALLCAHGGVRTLVDPARGKDFFQNAADRLLALVNPQGKALHDEDIRVLIHNEGRQVVRFAEHDAAAVFVPELFSVFPRGADAPFVELFAVLLVAADKDTHEYFGGVVDIPFADKPPVGGAHEGEGTVFVLAFDFCRFVGIYPTMSRKQPFFFVFLEPDRIRHRRSFSRFSENR